jgi:hypothetical protein
MKPVKADPQAYGSVITYQRRYALSAILGLNTDEDDDGNKASTQKEKLNNDTANYIDSLIHTSTYDDEQKEKMYKRVNTMTPSEAEKAIEVLKANQKSASEMENISQKGINEMLDFKDSDPKQ